MPLRPSLIDLDQLTDPAEREYVAAKRGQVPDDQLLDDLHQFRVIQAADRDEGRAPVSPADESTLNEVATPDGPPLPETPGDVSDSSGVPSFDEFYRDVAPLNPSYSREQIESVYNERFGEKPEVLPSLEEFKAETKPLNPHATDEDIRNIWQERFGSKGALEKNPGFLGTLAEGAKSTGRRALAFGQTLFGDTKGVESLAEEEGVAQRDPNLNRLLKEIAKRKEALGPDASWFDTGATLGKALLDDPKAAALLFTEQLPNTGAALAATAAGAGIGSLAGLAGTIAGGIAGLFLANVGLETGAKAIEKAPGGFTPMERATTLLEGAEKGGIISAIDLATFGGTKWLTSTAARAMEAATVRTLEQEGVDVSSRTAIEEARKNPALVEKVRQSQQTAVQGVNSLAQRAGRGAAEATLESVGEGAGEYLGELAASGKGDKMEAFLEAFAGLSQSTAEIGLSSVLSRRDRQAAVFGPAPDVAAEPIANITEAPNVDEAIKKAGEAIGETPVVDNEELDRFIHRGKTEYSDAQHAIDTEAFKSVLSGLRRATQLPSGEFEIDGNKISSRILRPDELPDEAPDGKTVTRSVYEALNTVLGAQGKRLAVYETNRMFDGVVRRSTQPDVVFISQHTATDPTSVAFHESAHLMEGTPMYKAFQQVLFSELRQGSKEIAKRRHGDLSDNRLFNEVSADIVGDAMMDPLFMEKVFTRLGEQVGEAKATTEAQGFLDRLKIMIGRVRDLITGTTFRTRNGQRLALKYVKNLERVHDALATAIADLYYNQGKAQTNTVDNIDEDYSQDARRQGEERLILPPDVAKTFEAIGHAQRDVPERAMLNVQERSGGGVLNPVVEHAGDLIHRMTHMASHGTPLRPYVQEKVDRVLKFLTHPYGFAKEMAENITANAEYYKQSPKELTQKVNEALAQYAAEHAKLPVYNLPQWLAKHAAIAIGHRRWDEAVRHLKELKALVDGEDFTTQAFAYKKNEERKLIPYERPLPVKFIGVTPTGGLRIHTDLESRQYHVTEDRDGFKAGTKISGKELKERGYRPEIVDLMSHEEDQGERALHSAGIAQASPTSDVGHKRHSSGKYVGAPPGVKNPQGLARLRERLLKLAKEGEPGREWYETSSKAVLEWAEGDRALAEKIVGLLAIYSPMQSIGPNTTIALKAYYQWANGEPITATNTQGKMSAERAQAWMDGTMNEREITGIKRNNFYVNLMREINPEVLTGAVQGVTVDMWVARAMGYFSTAVGEQQYKFSEREVKRIAEKLGWEPQQAQAAIWVSIKSRVEAVYNDVRERGKKNGWLIQKAYTGRDGKAASGWEPKDGESRIKFERALLAASLDIPLPDLKNATYNYADALRERVAQISWEATPGRSTGVLPGIHRASYGQQAEYLDAIDKALRNEDGQDKIAIMVKLAGANTIFGPGAWQGGLTIGGQTFTAVGTTRDGMQKVVVVTKEARRLVNLYADIRGYVLSQEGVYWNFPIFDVARKNANGVDLDFGRQLSTEEMKVLYQSIITWAGHDEWAPAFTDKGARVINFKDDNHLGFQETIKTALQTFPLDHTLSVFRSEGDARTNDWKEYPHGEEYRQRIEAVGRPDLLGAVEGLRQTVVGINRRFSERYGWGAPDWSGRRGTDTGGSQLSRTVARPYAEAARTGTDLQGLPSLVTVDGRQVEFHAFKPAQDIARKYMAAAGLPYTPERVYHKLDRARAERIAAAYDAMPHAPNDPQVKASYRALIDETIAQYRAMLAGGVRVEFIKGADPYGNPRNAILDVVENNHMWVYSTLDGFGTSAFDPSAHPLLEKTDILISGQPALANDIFRVVHDYFGHIKEGVGFRAEGEDNAWYAHMRMYSPLAQRALTSETRGQNSWVNFGPFGEQNRSASPAETHYADKKAGLMPEWVSRLDEEETQASPTMTQTETNSPRIGIPVDALPPNARAPKVDWNKAQAQPWVTGNPDDWKGTGWGKGRPVVYRAYVTEDELPQVRVSVDMGNPYDWKEFKRSGVYPPIVIVRHENGVASKLEDGHHRVTYWKKKGFKYFPAIVVDFRPKAKRAMKTEAQNDVSFSPAPIFVSQVERTLEQKLPNKASGQQILAMLKNTAGVKEEEIKWMALDDFLKSKETFTKDEVLRYVAANKVQIQEVEKGENPKTRTAYQLWNVTGEPYAEGDENTARRWREEGREVHEVQVAYDRDRGPNDTKFGSYQIPGGAAYRELLLTLPEVTAEDLARQKELRAKPIDTLTQQERDILSNIARGRGTSGGRGLFTSSHWREPNILAHTRFNERTVDGKRMLFLEEVQSDWHQKGKKQGYQGNADTTGWTAKEGAGDPASGPIWEVRNAQGRWILGVPRERGVTAEQAIARAANSERGPDANKVPEAPFKKTWHELVLRRMLRYAAEKGYDLLGWTTGEQQAERYDLSKQVKSLTAAKMPGDTWTLTAETTTGGPDRIPDNIPSSKLADYIGKDLADRILSEAGSKDKFIKTYTGIDLKVGGEGMRGFYDQILPAYLNKYAKKWGAKVEKISIPTDRNPWSDEEPLTFDQWVGGQAIDQENMPEIREEYRQYVKDFKSDFPQEFNIEQVHAVPITDAMRQSVLEEGQPQFSPAGFENERMLTLRVKRVELEARIESLLEDLRYSTDEEQSDIEDDLDSARSELARFERQHPDVQLAPRTIPAAAYDLTEPGRLDKFVRIMQDKNIDIKRIVESIRQAGGLVPDDLNPVLKEEMYQKRAQTRAEDFTNKELLPLLEVMRANKISLQDLDKYAHARHVIEDRLNARLKAMNPDMPDNDALSGMTDEDARAILDAYRGEREEVMRSLMGRLDGIINKTRQMMVDYGLEKESRVKDWRAQYKAYVPLRRTPYEEEGHPTGTGRSVRGSTVRERLGSKEEVSSILANVAQARDQIITRGEKMRPVVAMAGLLMLHPNKELASLDKPATIEMTDPLTGLTSTVPGDLANYKVPRIRYINPLTGLVEMRPDPTYKGRDNVVNFRIKGVDYAIVFNDRNERAVEIAKAFREMDTGKLTGILAAVAPYTRYLASINTQYNPIFGIVNFIRDAQFAMLALGSTPLAGKQNEIVKNALHSLAGIYQDARDSRLGLPPSSATAQMWERFTHVGGPTGYRDLFFTASDRAKEIERLLNPNTWKHIRSPQDFGRRIEETGLFKMLSDYNLTMENAIRLGVFKTGVESGLSDLQAASYAKNITVNFNKRGQIGAQMGALYAFFNANVQGTARILETLFERPSENSPFRLSAVGKKIVIGGLLIGILQTVALALGGFDDDEPPEFLKQKNLIFPMPGTDKGYLMIPMPLGFNLIPNIGRLAAESIIAVAKGRPRDVFTKGHNLFEAMVQTLSPTGGAGDVVAELSPTVADPFVSLKANRDWTGKEIYKEDRSSLTPTPGHTRAKDTATVWATFIAKAINWSTGGTDYTPGIFSPSPDAIDFLIQQATGGVGREISKTAQVVQSAVSGEELPFHKVPLAGRFGGTASGSAGIRDRFYDNIRAVNIAAEEIKGRALHHEEISSALASHPEARFEKAAIQIERQIGELRKAKALAIDRGASREAIRLRDDQIMNLMKRFNASVEEARKMR